jgi:ketosteroid isomerase-like protein
MSQENVEAVRRGYDAFNNIASGDWDAYDRWLEDFADPEVVLIEAPQFTGPREYRGWEGLRQWAKTGWELFEEVSYQPEEFIDAGDEVVVVAHVSGRGRGSGASVDMPLFQVFTLEHGKSLRIRAFFSKDEALEAAGLSE